MTGENRNNKQQTTSNNKQTTNNKQTDIRSKWVAPCKFVIFLPQGLLRGF